MSDKKTVTYPTVIVELEGRVARIILNRPEKLNAINSQLATDVGKALQDIDADEESRVVIVKGTGRAFSAGADLTPSDQRPAQWRHFLRIQRSVWPQLWYFRKPTISQVHGYCLAAGCSVALMCDLSVAAEDALIGQPEARAQGLIPDQGLWPFTIGPRRTKWLVFTGDVITGKEAEAMGMINKAVPADELEEYVEWLANRIAQMDMEMLSYHKQTINACYDIMGLPAMIHTGRLYWTLAQFAEVGDEFRRVAKEHGLRAAIAQRDAPFGGTMRQGMPLPRGPVRRRKGASETHSP
ncbi:MAG: enoyl-CoA hydratase/isomerase family protein [Chloroflexi bacterium]|nr:enoyl-CoA hydratase/isomerase family protein [Chloroflexota bacterium]